MRLERGQQFLSSLADHRFDLPFSPDLLGRLFNQTKESSLASLDEIARTIEVDQGLTAKILSLANSAYYGLQSQVNSVSRAATVLGLKEIRNIVLALSVRCLATTHPLPDEFDLRVYWRHQIRVALICGEVARRAGEADPDSLHTAGLLHDLGKLITAMLAPEDWRAIAALRREKGLAPEKAEDLYWGIDHGVVGSLVLRAWNLPPELTEPVNWHHTPRSSPDFRRASTLLCLADALLRSHTDDATWAEQADTLCDELDLSRESAEEAVLAALANETVEHFISEVAA
jgi:putative nucleotidyltransferase with HDIG domain